MKLLAAAILILASLSDASSVPKISYDELKSIPGDPSLLERIKDDGDRIGAFAVTGIPLEGYADDVRGILGKAGECVGGDAALPRLELSGGSTRTTFATVDNVYPECLAREADTVSRAFQLVSNGVFAAVETALGGAERGYVSGEADLRLAEAPHKDHIHFYARYIED